VAFSPAAKILAVGSDAVLPSGNEHVSGVQTSLWNTTTGTIVGTLIDPNTMGVDAMAFAPDGATLAVDDSNGRVYLWNIATKTLTATLTPPGNPQIIFAVDLTPGGTTLAGGDGDGNTYLWKITYHGS